MTLRRVTVTVPADVLEAADTAARRLGRSRSWVVTEALRRFESDAAAPPLRQVRETAAGPYGRAMDAARAALRGADLTLTPEERLQAADELSAEVSRLRPRPRGPVRQVLIFERPEDYWAWQKHEVRW